MLALAAVQAYILGLMTPKPIKTLKIASSGHVNEIVGCPGSPVSPNAKPAGYPYAKGLITPKGLIKPTEKSNCPPGFTGCPGSPDNPNW